ncbi:hypothetical protein [Streptomyces johnsoniae]|nr:hypothetical protein [Streptomyces sp. DSM 41886]
MSSGVSTGVPRRALLASCLLAGALTGCTSSGGAGAGGRAAAGAAGLRRRAARASTGLLARYDATAAAHPALAGPLTPFRDIVAAHLSALTEADTGGAGPEGAAPEVPGEASRAVSELATAERQAADERMGALAEAPPELARLLAALAAAGAVSAHLLNEVRA